MNEIWKDIPGYEGRYQASTMGNIKSVARLRKCKHNSNAPVKERILKQYQDKYGYMRCALCKEGKPKAFQVHRLVAFAFPEICGDYFEEAQINHKDCNPSNNSAWNLEWCTVIYNINYGNRTEKATRIDNPNRCKKVLQYDLNGNIIKEWMSFAQINRETGYDRKGIINCCKHKNNTAYGFKWSYK